MSRFLRRRAWLVWAASGAMLCAAPHAFAQQRALLVFAAASLKDALDEVVAAWRLDTGSRAVVSYAASSALARQIESGAPADLFISADREWMDYLEQRRLIRAQSRTDLLGNRLVLIAPKDSAVQLEIAPGFPIAAALGPGRLAMANTDAVPAGRYGKAALSHLGVWPAVSGRVAQALDVRGALLIVARGEAPLGIVYATDAAADARVRVVDRFPAGSHPPIVYPSALTATAGERAHALLAYLRSAAAKAIWQRHGFAVPGD